MSEATVETVEGQGPRRLPGVRRALREVLARPTGAFGLAVVGALLIVLAFAQWLAPYGPAVQDIPARLQGPSIHHLFGTDDLGRDLLSRILFGARVAFAVAMPAVGIALFFGLLLGLLAGYAGGWVDNILVVVMDTLQAFPAVLLALALLALVGPSLRNLVVVIGVAFTPNYARVTRALVRQSKANQYIEAERSLGASNRRIVLIHILPNIVPSLFILMAMDIPGAIATAAGLSFLGLGVQPPTADWGVILADGFTYVRQSPWAIVWASLALMVTTLGFTTLGESLRDAVDPRLRKVSWRAR